MFIKYKNDSAIIEIIYFLIKIICEKSGIKDLLVFKKKYEKNKSIKNKIIKKKVK